MKYLLFPAAALILLAGCQKSDIEIAAPKLAPIDAAEITGRLDGNDFIWTWPAQGDLQMQVLTMANGQTIANETVSGNTYTQHMVATNVPFTYVFKLTDGEAWSLGVIKEYTRPGASAVSGVQMAQVEAGAGYDIKVEWTPSADATSTLLTATCGTRTVNATLSGTADSYIIPGVTIGEEWTTEITAENVSGKSLPATASLRIGSTAVGYLSAYPTEADLLADGDDDEASAWLWMKEAYPAARYVYFGDITSAADIAPFRVLFWLRDLEDNRPSCDVTGDGVVNEDDVFKVPAVVEAATPYIRQWYADGGSLLLWSHATAYIGNLGRLETDMLRSNDRSIGLGAGGDNGDSWSMAVQLNPGGAFVKDASTHPIFKGMEVTSTDRTKLIPFKGPGWTEDHNCLYFNIPSALTGLGNQDEACYNTLVSVYGITPLGTWDSQIDYVSQLNVWEAGPGNTDFKGTILCIGNGGCEFSMKNPDGTPDISAHPKNNIHQANVLRLAANAIEYLKTR
ncbi:MAG: DUF4960 domain-containing protein [Bacteroides sp.]|nr:DUF4960 domain-containing protein [Bacteroides sp.]